MGMVILIFIRIACIAAVMSLGEILGASVIFPWLKRRFNHPSDHGEQPDQQEAEGVRRRAVFMGVLERLLLVVGLVAGIQQVLIAFGALKIASRFKPAEDTKIRNEYFLVGNFVSLLMAILYHLLSWFIYVQFQQFLSAVFHIHLGMMDAPLFLDY